SGRALKTADLRNRRLVWPIVPGPGFSSRHPDLHTPALPEPSSQPGKSSHLLICAFAFLLYVFTFGSSRFRQRSGTSTRVDVRELEVRPKKKKTPCIPIIPGTLASARQPYGDGVDSP